MISPPSPNGEFFLISFFYCRFVIYNNNNNNGLFKNKSTQYKYKVQLYMSVNSAEYKSFVLYKGDFLQH